MDRPNWTHVCIYPGGQLVRRRTSTLVEAAEELAAWQGSYGHPGQVVFTCPNYAVVVMAHGREVTVWNK